MKSKWFLRSIVAIVALAIVAIPVGLFGSSIVAILFVSRVLVQATQQNGCDTNLSSISIGPAPVKLTSKSLKPGQLKIAKAIAGVAAARGLPKRDAKIGIMTSYQETKLRALNYGDAAGPDSRGPFMQRAPWGPLSVRMDPVGSSNLFFDAEQKIANREQKSLQQVAEAVQIPAKGAYNAPQNRFMNWEPLADDLLKDYVANDTETDPQILAEGSECDDGSGNYGNSSQVAAFIAKLKSQLGKPYIWGAESPTVGFDCSGLVQWAAKEVGLTLPRVANVQWNSGTAVARNDLQPGDLVFWGNPKGSSSSIYHVGVYIGNGQLLNAPNSKSVVRIQPMYYENYFGAKRIFKASDPLPTDSAGWQLPMKRGTYAKTGSGGQYGPRIHPVTGLPGFHNGVDLGTGNNTPPLYAAHAGRVVRAGFDSCWGNYIVIQGGGVGILYPHMSTPSSRLLLNKDVAKGEKIGNAGGTGCVTGNHLHLSVCTDIDLCLKGSGAHGKGTVDPVAFFRSKGVPLFGSNA